MRLHGDDELFCLTCAVNDKTKGKIKRDEVANHEGHYVCAAWLIPVTPPPAPQE